MADPLFEFYRGDDFALQFNLTDDANNPIDITGWVIKASLKLDPQSTNGATDIHIDMPALSDAAAKVGSFVIQFDHTQTANLYPTTYQFGVQREFSGEVNTVITGLIKVKQDVTQRVG